MAYLGKNKQEAGRFPVNHYQKSLVRLILKFALVTKFECSWMKKDNYNVF